MQWVESGMPRRVWLMWNTIAHPAPLTFSYGHFSSIFSQGQRHQVPDDWLILSHFHSTQSYQTVQLNQPESRWPKTTQDYPRWSMVRRKKTWYCFKVAQNDPWFNQIILMAIDDVPASLIQPSQSQTKLIVTSRIYEFEYNFFDCAKIKTFARKRALNIMW